MLFKEASKKLKPDKSDPVSEMVLDYLINAPDILYQHLLVSDAMKSYITHGPLTHCNNLHRLTNNKVQTR